MRSDGLSITHGGDLYAIARRRGWNWREVLDLSASINPLGPAPGVRDAIVQGLDRIVHYPERSPARLAERLASLWQITPDQLMLGNGATELLHFLARVWPHQQVTLAVPVFSEFHRAYPAAACVPWSDMVCWPSRGLFVLTQPNNPTGLGIDPERLSDWLLTTYHPVLVDESFIEFTGLRSTLALLNRRRNLLVLRSLTKFYALPGLRIGALAGDAGLLAALSARREPWQVNVLAEEAALAAIGDAGHASRSREYIAGEREWLWEHLVRLPGVTPARSEANYYLLHVESGAADLCGWMLDRRVILRDCTGSPGLEGEAVRFAIRTRPENEILVRLLKEYLCAK